MADRFLDVINKYKPQQKQQPTSSYKQPTSSNKDSKVDLYYDIDNPSRQYSKPVGSGGPVTPVTNPVTNPQNVQPNTNLGTGHRSSSNTQKVDVYYNIDDKTQQYTQPTGNYSAQPKPVVNPSYSYTVPEEAYATTYNVNYSIEPSSVTPNINERTANPIYTIKDIDFKKEFVNSFAKSDPNKINVETYMEQKAKSFDSSVNRFVSKNPYVYTGITLSSPVLTPFVLNKDVLTNTKVPFSYTQTAKFIAFAPYMETGAMTYRGLFGKQTVTSSEKAVYLSPVERVQLPSTLNKLAAKDFKSLGQDAIRVDDTTTILQYTGKKTPGAELISLSRTDLTQLSNNNIGVVARQNSILNVKTLSGNTFTQRLSGDFFQGSLSNIAKTNLIQESKGVSNIQEGVTGKLKGFFYPEGNPLKFREIKGVTVYSKLDNSGKFFNVLSLKDTNNIYATSKLISGGKVLSQKTASTNLNYNILGRGKIFTNLEGAGKTGNIFKGISKSSGSTFGKLGTFPMPSTSQSTGIIQSTITGEQSLGSAVSGTTLKYSVLSRQTPTFTSSQALDYSYKTALLSSVRTSSNSLRLSPSIPTLRMDTTMTKLFDNNIQDTRQIPIVTTSSGSSTRVDTVQKIIQNPTQDTKISFGFSTPTILPSYSMTPIIPPTFLKPKLSFDDLTSGTKIFGAFGRRKYTPSFDALIKGIRGKQPKGIFANALGTRPIPKGFSFTFSNSKLGRLI